MHCIRSAGRIEMTSWGRTEAHQRAPSERNAIGLSSELLGATSEKKRGKKRNILPPHNRTATTVDFVPALNNIASHAPVLTGTVKQASRLQPFDPDALRQHRLPPARLTGYISSKSTFRESTDRRLIHGPWINKRGVDHEKREVPRCRDRATRPED